MCVLALVLFKGITFCYAGLTGVVMQGRYAGLTLRNPYCQAAECNRKTSIPVSSK